MSNANGAGKVVPLRAPHRNRGVNLWQREVVLEELDYLDTPPSPIRMWLILIICGLFCFAVGASIVTQIDTYAIAQARVQPSRGTAVVQPFAAGRVTAIHVSDGDHVNKGDSLVELDALDGTEEINTRAIDAARTKGDEAPQGPTTVIGKSDQTRLVAPINGTVQTSSGTMIGQIVSSKQTLLSIVPDDPVSEVTGWVSTHDIASVRTGQHAILKLDALPFAQYGTFTGTVVRISREPIEDKQLRESSADIRAKRRAPYQEAYFPVTVKLDRPLASQKSIPLAPGMTGRLEIRTDQRSAMEYLLSPILEVAGRER